jgi:hypothetical protein
MPRLCAFHTSYGPLFVPCSVYRIAPLSESTVTAPDIEDTLRRVSVVFQQHICRGERTLRGLQRGDVAGVTTTPRPEELVLKVKAGQHVKKVADERKRGGSAPLHLHLHLYLYLYLHLHLHIYLSLHLHAR